MVGMADYARPGCYRVQHLSGMGYVVLDPSGQVIRDSQTPFKVRAEQQRDTLQREADQKAKRFDRPCLCCQRVFASAVVRGVFERPTVSCPAQGELASNVCRDWQLKARKFSAENSERTRMYRACNRCPRYRAEGTK